MVTCDVVGARGRGAYGAALTPGGKIFVDAFINRTDDTNATNATFLLDIDRDRVEEASVSTRTRIVAHG